MNEALLYAIVTGVSGAILLLGWLYVTADNPRSNTILLKSVPLFVAPGAILVVLPENWLQFPLSLWVFVLVEESIKAVSSTTEERPSNRFALVALFGIWELMLAKPIWGIENSVTLEGWSRLQLAGLTLGGMVTVLMHAVTAQIYAFRFDGRLTTAFAVSCLIHGCFNESVGLFGASLLTSLLQLLVLVPLCAALWSKDQVPPPVQSSSSS